MTQLNDSELDQILGDIQELQHKIQATPVPTPAVAAATPAPAPVAKTAAPAQVATPQKVAATPVAVAPAPTPVTAPVAEVETNLTLDAMPQIMEEGMAEVTAASVAQTPSIEELEALVSQAQSEMATEAAPVSAPPVAKAPVANASAAEIPADLLETLDELENAKADEPVEEVMMEEVLSSVHPEEGDVLQAPAAKSAVSPERHSGYSNVIQAPFPRNGNQTMNLQLTYEGQVINVSFSGGFIFIVMADGTEFKIPTQQTKAALSGGNQSQAG